MLSSLKSYLSPSKESQNGGNAEEGTAVATNGGSLNETTSLLDSKERNSDATSLDNLEDIVVDPVQKDVLHPLPKKSPTVKEYYFTPNNPTVQRYYRFAATPITPIVALHKQPGSANSAIISSGVTGLLRRSAVVPSHGTDATGDWILVSVGGRSGWARKKRPEQHFSGFTLAESFAATEGWMGNHSFLCRGKIMLGSDGPSLFFTNILLLVGYAFHFVIVIPKLRIIEDEHPNAPFMLHTEPVFWASVLLGTMSVIMLWVSAMMDPGIIPAVSSPVKAPLPAAHIPIGGPLGYRYCSSCNIFRPPRSKHCNSCNVCVSKFDQ
jgi:DHHC palmitoyltransferase